MTRRVHITMTVTMGSTGPDLGEIPTGDLGPSLQLWVAQGLAGRVDSPQVTYWVAEPEDSRTSSGASFGLRAEDSVSLSAAVWLRVLRQRNELDGYVEKLARRLREAEKDAERLRRLEAAGVDNWEGYGRAFRDEDGDCA